MRKREGWDGKKEKKKIKLNVWKTFCFLPHWKFLLKNKIKDFFFHQLRSEKIPVKQNLKKKRKLKNTKNWKKKKFNINSCKHNFSAQKKLPDSAKLKKIIWKKLIFEKIFIYFFYQTSGASTGSRDLTLWLTKREIKNIKKW